MAVTGTGSTLALDGALTLAATGLPSGVSATFSPNPMAASGLGAVASTLTLAATTAAAVGAASIAITGSSPASAGAIPLDSASTTLALTITAPSTSTTQNWVGARGVPVATYAPSIVSNPLPLPNTQVMGSYLAVLDGTGHCDLGSTPVQATAFYDQAVAVPRVGGSVTGTLTLGAGCEVGFILRQVGKGQGLRRIGLPGASPEVSSDYYCLTISARAVTMNVVRSPDNTGLDVADPRFDLGQFQCIRPRIFNPPSVAAASLGAGVPLAFRVVLSPTTLAVYLYGASDPTYVFVDATLPGPFNPGFGNQGIEGTTGNRLVGAYSATGA